ncbi:MAG: glycosyltransferase, partial [Albimonas sp.]
EAMACGRPVLAYGRGGALDTVKEGVSGLLFDAQTAESLAEAMRRFETEMEPGLDPERVAAHAQSFGPEQFRAGMWSAIRRMAPELGLPEAPPAVAQAA